MASMTMTERRHEEVREIMLVSRLKEFQATRRVSSKAPRQVSCLPFEKQQIPFALLRGGAVYRNTYNT